MHILCIIYFLPAQLPLPHSKPLPLAWNISLLHKLCTSVFPQSQHRIRRYNSNTVNRRMSNRFCMFLWHTVCTHSDQSGYKAHSHIDLSRTLLVVHTACTPRPTMNTIHLDTHCTLPPLAMHLVLADSNYPPFAKNMCLLDNLHRLIFPQSQHIFHSRNQNIVFVEMSVVEGIFLLHTTHTLYFLKGYMLLPRGNH